MNFPKPIRETPRDLACLERHKAKQIDNHGNITDIDSSSITLRSVMSKFPPEFVRPTLVPGTDGGVFHFKNQQSSLDNHQSIPGKPRGQSLILPSSFASWRLCVRPKDPRQQPGPLMDADGPLMQGPHWCQAQMAGARHQWRRLPLQKSSIITRQSSIHPSKTAGTVPHLAIILYVFASLRETSPKGARHPLANGREC